MFIFLYYLFLNMKCTYSTIIVQNAGLYEIKRDDIAMIFFITVENTYDFNIPVTLSSIECMEGDPYLDTANYMYLLGSDMSFLDKKRTTNLTLIYPNLYLANRVGKCLVSLHYQIHQSVEEIRKEIFFDSNKVLYTTDGNRMCNTCDLNGAPDCIPVDCVVKYSSRRSYFNSELQTCQAVPECPPNSVYIPESNICRKLHEPVCKPDLEMIEDGYVERSNKASNVVNLRCHHGTVSNNTGECVCGEGWTTSTCLEAAYHPTLNLYHMCNIELKSWQRANKEKLVMTVVVLIILALALAAKMLVAVCLLNWCCHFLKLKSKNDETYCGDYVCPYSYCEDDAGSNVPQEKSSKTIRVSFSNISSADDSDVTVSVEDHKLSCHCTESHKTKQ